MNGAPNNVQAAQAAMKHIMAVAAQWHLTLPHSAHVSAAGSLVELLCHWCCEQILCAPMMAEAAIDGVILVLEEIASFENELAMTVFASEGDQMRVSAPKRIAVYVPSWPKLAALQRFLPALA